MADESRLHEKKSYGVLRKQSYLNVVCCIFDGALRV